jgi:TRAP-type mannitol/chloroaromatic compound transport system substrate-binding protein
MKRRDFISKNASFKKVYDSMTDFSNSTYQWFQVAELGHSHG